MIIAKIAYLSTPGPDRFVLNVQTFGNDVLQQFEITKAHMINILLDGTALALRESNRVQPTTSMENADEPASAGA
jgi:hypothetical protein